MNQQLRVDGRILMVAAMAALASLTPARADSNPEAGAFYTLNPDVGEAADANPRGAEGRIGADDPPGIAAGAAPALNPELGSFYSLGRDLANRAETNSRGAAGPIRREESSDSAARVWRPINREAGAFYGLSAIR